MASSSMKIILVSIEPNGKSCYSATVSLDDRRIISLVFIEPNDPPICGLRIENETLSRFLFLVNCIDNFTQAFFSFNASREIFLPLICGVVNSEWAIAIWNGLERGESLDSLHKKFPGPV